MIELTPQQHAAVEAGDTRIQDPAGTTYILVREETYRKLQDLLETGPLTAAEGQAILKGVWNRAGWDDPRMDAYN